MTDHDLADLLERSAERIPIGTPPLPEMVAGADHLRRRRRARRAAVSSAAVAVVIAGTALVSTHIARPSLNKVDKPVATQSATPIPAGTRLVGIGHPAIAVPEDWATNALRCGTATGSPGRRRG
ncbi:MAG: hypothetical protein QM714_06335 [Nocardioides sp.]|uniref:hypothetical protein n=1 Tax=Nocardioides sp. TaxID=35761 RepID=UPI0039E36A6F